jgi:hypothetical protein
MPQVFFILGLPRSRTIWLANLFTYARSICYHEPSKHFEKIENLKSLFEISKKPFQGVSDSGLTIFHEEINELFNNPPILLIDRPVNEVVQSLGEIGIPNSFMTELTRLQMEKIKTYPNTLTIPFHEMTEKNLAKAWEHCMPGEKFDHLRWAELNDMMIEVNLQKTMSIVYENSSKLTKFITSARCMK